MLEIVSKNNNLYSVLDTEDDAVESCSFLDIISAMQSRVDIKGVSPVNDEYAFEIDGLKAHKVMKAINSDYTPARNSRLIFRNVLAAADFYGIIC